MRRRLAIIAYLLIIMLPPATAQFIPVAHSARSSAMGGCFLTDFDERHLDIGYRQGFMLAGMADKRLSLVWPTGKIGVATVSYLHHGNLDYHEQQVAAGYAVRPWPWLLAGVSATYLNLGTSDPHYSPRHWLAATAYVQASLGANTTVAAIAGTRPWDDTHPYQLHLQVRHSPTVGLTAVVEGEMEECARLRMGIEYCYEKMVFFRVGAATAPLMATFGVGFRHRAVSIDLGAEVHQTLGLTPHSTLTLWF